MLQELSVLLSCQVQGGEGGMWKLKLIMKNDIVSCEEESLACFVEIFHWLHCIIHVLSAMNQDIKKKRHTEETSLKCALRIVVSSRHKISYWGKKLLFSDTAFFPPCRNPKQCGLESTASKQGNVLVPLTSEKYSCNCLVFLRVKFWKTWEVQLPSPTVVARKLSTIAKNHLCLLSKIVINFHLLAAVHKGCFSEALEDLI